MTQSVIIHIQIDFFIDLHAQEDLGHDVGQ